MDQYVGGLVGANQGGAVYNSYNRRSVKCDSDNVGGLVGIHETCTGSDDVIVAAVMENCYTEAEVSGSSNVGLAVGKCDGATITNCYYNYDDTYVVTDAIGKNVNSQSVTLYSPKFLRATLNSNASTITGAETWVSGTEPYPTFSFVPK